MEALRDLADDFNVRDPRKLYRLARQRDLDVTQALAFEALKADVGRQVQAPRPRALGKSAAEGPNDRLQADLIDFKVRPGGDGRLRPGGRRGTSAEQERRDGGPHHQARRKGADGWSRRTWATSSPRWTGSCLRKPCTKRPEGRRTWPRGWRARAGSGATTSSGRPGPTTRAPRDGHGAPEDMERQPATEFRVLQDNADKFQHNKDLTDRRVKAGGRGRLPSADERGEELQPSVRRRAAAGGRGLHDRPQHGGPRDPAEAGAAGAAGQRQRGGPADETGQAGGREAAGRLPGASEDP